MNNGNSTLASCILIGSGLAGVMVSMEINHHKFQNGEYNLERRDENNDGKEDFIFKCREGYGSYTFLNRGNMVYVLKDK